MLVAILAMTVAAALLSQCFVSPRLGAIGSVGVLAIGVTAFGWAIPVAAVAAAVAVLLGARASRGMWRVSHHTAAVTAAPCDLHAILPIDWERFMRDLADWSATRGGRARRS
jgi:hypothetical protein